ncbi:unnamed protein product [Rotaria sp. Silwood1]|nr:unnamed protein product [Rotaria sp. Silwood1]
MINSFGFIMIETFFFYKDSEQGEDQWRDFTGLESKEIRRGFIRKMGMISAYYKIESVLIAVGITVFVCLGITLFSFQTKYDFTSCFGVLLVISLIFLAFGIVCIFTYSRFLAVDTRLLIGGKQHEISAEDHVFASLMLYIDVLYIFIYILSLLGNWK